MSNNEVTPDQQRRRLLKMAAAVPLIAGTSLAGLSTGARADTLTDAPLFKAWVAEPGIPPALRKVRTIISEYFLSLPANASMAQKRIARANLYLKNIPLPNDLRFTSVDTAGVRGEWADTPSADPHRVLFYLHGGGYVVGSPQGWRAVGAVLGRSAGMRTFSLEYRLAPEHAYPAALDDTVAGYRWLLDQGIDPRHIGFAGDSAGGGLALCTLLKARALGLPMPAAAYLMSPWTDLTMSGASIDHPRTFDPFNRRVGLIGSAGKYLQGHDPKDPFVSPLFGDLAGLPPLLVHIGDDEAYLDDATAIARVAAGAGVPVQLKTWPQMFHVWQAWGPLLPQAAMATNEAATFLRQAVA
jgi:acetyl esterase/lipase